MNSPLFQPSCEYCGGDDCRCSAILANKTGGTRVETPLACPQCGGTEFRISNVKIPKFYVFDGSAFSAHLACCTKCGWRSLSEDNGELRLLANLALRESFGGNAVRSEFVKKWRFATAGKPEEKETEDL